MFLSFLFPWSRLPDRGRSVSKVPRRGNRSARSTSQVPGPTTYLSSPSHKAASSTPQITPRYLAIGPRWSRQSEPPIVTKGHTNDTGLALNITRPRLAKQSRSSHINPKSIDPSLDTSRQLPDKVALFRDFRDYTDRDGSQCPDHGSLLPRSPGRTCVFRRNGYDGSTHDLEVLGSHRDVTSDNRPLTQVLVPKGSDDGSTTAINTHLPLDGKSLDHDRDISLPN